MDIYKEAKRLADLGTDATQYRFQLLMLVDYLLDNYSLYPPDVIVGFFVYFNRFRKVRYSFRTFLFDTKRSRERFWPVVEALVDSSNEHYYTCEQITELGNQFAEKTI